MLVISSPQRYLGKLGKYPDLYLKSKLPLVPHN